MLTTTQQRFRLGVGLATLSTVSCFILAFTLA